MLGRQGARQTGGAHWACTVHTRYMYDTRVNGVQGGLNGALARLRGPVESGLGSCLISLHMNLTNERD
uniref:Uncharacterized protein n=1 Tax=Anguilla anguilla TaxID=7936 RepID=A0A0E9QM58_ANGAN